MSTVLILGWCVAASLAAAAILLGAAGRLDLLSMWAYAGLWLLSSIAGVLTADPGLVRERLRPGPGARETFALAVFAATVIVLAHWVIAGVDVGRLHWSDAVPRALRWMGFLVLGTSLAVAHWSTYVNPFFSSVVRIQSERGHRVVSSGPYAYVRHPGYAAGIGMALSSGLALGSWLSVLPNLFGIALLVRRIGMEESVLAEDLDGYDEYRRRVRYRLVPGVW